MTTVAQAHDPGRALLLLELQAAVDAAKAARQALEGAEDHYAACRGDELQALDDVKSAMATRGVNRIVIGGTLVELVSTSPSPASAQARLTRLEVVP